MKMAQGYSEWLRSTKPLRPGPYIARSASDKTPDWPFWYVAGPDGRTNYMTGLGGRPSIGVFTTKQCAQALAAAWSDQ